MECAQLAVYFYNFDCAILHKNIMIIEIIHREIRFLGISGVTHNNIKNEATKKVHVSTKDSLND